MNGMKIVMLGDAGVGKTSMLIRLTTDEFPAEYLPSSFDNNNAHRAEVDGSSIDIVLWDTAGGDEYDRLRPLCFPGTDVFILNFSVTSPPSLDSIRTMYYPEIAHHMPRTPFILVATKTDLRIDENTLTKINERWGRGPIDSYEGQAVARELGAAAYLETSALLGENVTELFDSAVRTMREGVVPGQGANGGTSTGGKKLSKCSLL